jgi:hypothetical protein
MAQPRQSVTHGRLAQTDALAGARHAPFLHHRVEHDEQVEVDRAEFDGGRSCGHAKCTIVM